MKTYVNNLDQCIGKKLTSIGYHPGGAAVLAFDNNTFTLLLAKAEEEGFVSLTIPLTLNLNYSDYRRDDCLIQAGVCSKAELDAIYAASEEAGAKAEKETRRQYYEVLKKEFEPETK